VADALHVELVSVERPVWSGEASMVIARTTEGELGVLPGHAPLLGELAEGWIVRIQQEDGEELVAAVHGGFLSVTGEGVSILAEIAELADDVDVERARRAYESTAGADNDDDEAQAAKQRAMSRLRAAGETV
jgi:F-type H+-transporting ATPase subunit epsilon